LIVESIGSFQASKEPSQVELERERIPFKFGFEFELCWLLLSL
jgi:hypothetical protein